MGLVTDTNRKWWILGAMGSSLGLMVLDETIVGVALPTLGHDLGLSQTAAHWVVNAYLLVFASFAAAMGKLGDMVGLKRLFILGLLIFALTSLAAGFAQNEASIIAARALQGIGAAIILPGSMAMMMNVFPPAQRGTALGIYGAIGTFFLAAGPLLGGVLTEYLSWRWIFWVNPPIVVLIGLVVAVTWRDPPRQDASSRFDSAGLITLVAGLGMLVLALMQAPDWGWFDPAVVVLFVAGIVVLIIFVMIEFKIRAPLIEVDLFANKTLTACNLVIFIGQFTKTSVYVLGALYFQHKLGMSALEAGIAMLWAVAMLPVMAIVVGRVTDRLGARGPALFGLVVTALSFLWIAYAANGSGLMIMVPGLLVMGFGQVFLFVPAMRAVSTALPDEKQGQAGGIMLTGQLLGGTMGMTLLGMLLVMTGDFQIVFLTTAAITIVVTVIAWAWIERDGEAKGSET